MPHNDEDSANTEGMVGIPGVLTAALSVASVLSLSLLSLLCLRCKKKSQIIHEEHQVYNPQMFQRAGSMFAVTRSKTVTRTNEITSRETYNDFSAASIEEQSDYENIINAQTGIVEHTYVHPLPITTYHNDQTQKSRNDFDQTPGVYVNITPSSVKEDDSDYENSEFLNNVVKKPEEHDEPDYVNQNGDAV